MTAVETILTAGEIATALGEPQHRIDYVLNTRRHIEYVRKVGNARAYAESVLKVIRQELVKIDARRVAGGAR